MPFVKYTGPDEREVPDLRLIVQPNHTYEVTADQVDGLLCQSIWEKSKETKSAPEAAPPRTDPDLADSTIGEAKT